MQESPQAELQKVVYDALVGTPAVMALVNGVWDQVPPKPFDPFKGPHNGYVAFGPLNAINDDAECIVSTESFLQIDCWSRQVGQVHCKRITDAVCAALHNRDMAYLEATSANGFVLMQVDARQVLRDPDGATTHGVITLRCLVEETV
jgi:hypothetical protein